MGLHGGSALLKVYTGCGSTALPAGPTLPAEVKRKNDGRFFYPDENTSMPMKTPQKRSLNCWTWVDRLKMFSGVQLGMFD